MIQNYYCLQYICKSLRCLIYNASGDSHSYTRTIYIYIPAGLLSLLCQAKTRSYSPKSKGVKNLHNFVLLIYVYYTIHMSNKHCEEKVPLHG